MTFITFTYKMGKNTYNGKYATNSYSYNDVYIEIQSLLINGIRAYRKQKGLLQVPNIEIVSFSSYTNSTIPDDMLWFDFYHTDGKTYINGRLIDY